MAGLTTPFPTWISEHLKGTVSHMPGQGLQNHSPHGAHHKDQDVRDFVAQQLLVGYRCCEANS